MRITRVLCTAMVLSLVVEAGLSQKKEVDEVTLITMGDSNFSMDEFDYYFLKNTDRPSAIEAKSAVNEYLSLFINFKLKVKEAITLKMDKDPAFIEEFSGYQNQLLEPFLSTSIANENLILEAYERLQVEVSGTHLLIAPKASNTPEDTLIAYNKALEYKKRAESGEDLSELAKKYSEDKSAANNGGYLGYFTAMQMVYPFENAAYNAEIGEIVGPFKTRFGYHVLRIDDKRPARGQAKAAHIMVRYSSDSTSQEKSAKKIQSIYQSLQEGKDWDELCKLYSDDKNTSSKRGELKWFGTGQLVPEFEDATFDLDSIGSISKPVKTRFGWHIIKLLGKKPRPTLEEKRADIEKRIAKDSRTSIKKTTALKLIKEKNQYELDSVGYQAALEAVDSTLIQGLWQYDTLIAEAEKPVFSLNDKIYRTGDFWSYVLKNQKKRKTTPLPDYVSYLYNRFEEKSIFDYEKEYITNNNLEYQMIADEYRSGILLFNLMEEKVWNKAIKDTTGIATFYEKNKSDYPIGPHLKGRKIVLSDTSLLSSLINQLSLSNKQLDSLYNSKEPLTLQVEEVTVFKEDNEFINNHWEKGNHIEKSEDYVTIWSINEIVSKGYKDLDSIKGTVISDYQKSLEEKWIKELKKKYPVKVIKPVLKKYISSFE
ncbi:MAG: peptidylprolyl isomerase [Reichenbachiella sp.]